MRLWDAETHTLLRMLTGHRGVVQAVAFSPDGTTVASGGVDTIIRIGMSPKGRKSAG